MTHEHVVERDIIEQYVRHTLSPADRQAFQEHYFACDDCFEQVQAMARFVAAVRDASAAGVLADGRAHRPSPRALFSPSWFPSWSMPALAAAVLVAAVLLGVWSVTVWRENQRLTQQAAEQRRAVEMLRSLEAKVRGLESSGAASEQEKVSLRQRIRALEEQLATARDPVRPEPGLQVAAINIYPVGDAQRSASAGEINRLKLPARAATFVLLLSDFQPGAPKYQVEIADSAGAVVSRRAGLTPDQNGEISITLNRSTFSQGRYSVKLLAQGKTIAVYAVEIE